MARNRSKRSIAESTPLASRASLKTDDPDIKELHEAFDYSTDAWRDIRDEAQVDMRYISGDPWHPDDRTMRENAGRPVISMDELGQYVNQIVNDVRQNKRAIKVTPLGNGANDQSAALRADLWRQIEYRSNAQQAYTTMFENAVQRSYGYLRIVPQYVSPRSRHQELMIQPIVNPDLVTPDPDALSPDLADIKFLFNQESWSQAEFKKRFKDAKVQDFSTDLMGQVPRWVKDERIMLAEWWRVTPKKKRLIYYDVPAIVLPGQPPQPPQELDLFEDETPPKGAKRVGERMADVPVVTKRLTNGIEILDEETWLGRHIPFVGCFGKILYLDNGSGPEKTILSAIRLARDPQMLYCYYRTAEAEQVGMSTRFPWFIRQGSLSNTEANKLAQSTHEPVAFIQVKGVSDDLPPGQVPEMPVRNTFVPEIQALEVGAEGTRRAIQAAMGISPLPTPVQRINQKSGAALKQIEDSSQKGTFHFVDHYEGSITRTAVIGDDLIPHYYDAARDLTVRKPDDTPIQVRVNDPAAVSQKASPYAAPGNAPMLTDGAEHDHTLSTGPDFESEREAANDYADTLVQNLPIIAQVAGQQAAAKIMALSVKLKDIGPLGQEMADTISPPNADAPTPKEQALQGQLSQAAQALQNAHTIIQTKQVEQNGMLQKAKLDNDTRIEIEKINSATQIAIAEAKVNAENFRSLAEASDQNLARLEGLKLKLVDAHLNQDEQHRDQAHDVGMQALGHAHATRQADQAGQQVLDQQTNSAALNPPTDTPGGEASPA